MRIQVIALLLVCVFSTAMSRTTLAGEDVDFVALAARLLQGGDADRAKEVLQEVNVSDPDVDVKRYETLSGLVALRLSDPVAASTHLERALNQAPRDHALNRLVAHAYFAQGECAKTLRHLRASKQQAWKHTDSIAVRSTCLHRQGKDGAALDVLREGQRLHPHQADLRAREVELLAGLGLTQELLKVAQGWLNETSTVPSSELLGVMGTLLRIGASQDAVALGEQMHLNAPHDFDVTTALAQAYAKAGQPLAAARLFERLSFTHNEHAAAAAEMFRKAGRMHLAALAISRIADREEKLRQRFGLLLDTQRFQEAAAMAVPLQRAGVTHDDTLLYALSFAQMKAGQLDAAEQSATGIQDPEVFRRVSQLLQVIAQCKEEPWRCQ